jgi:hypothetical protein
VPPTDPVAYRVARLDLARGTVTPVATGVKGVVETMSGTRLEQLATGDGTMLYTLYTTEPAAYATAHDGHGRPVAFVHTLNLTEEWAHCIPLPKQFWGGDPGDEAMALSPDGDTLYVVDTARDLVAAMDVDRLEFGPAVAVDFGPAAPSDAAAATVDDGSVVATEGRSVTVLDPATLQPVREWTARTPVAALGSGPEGLYLAMEGAIGIVDPSTGRATATIQSPAAGGASSVTLADR